MLFQDFFLDFVHTIKGWGIKKNTVLDPIDSHCMDKKQTKSPKTFFKIYVWNSYRFGTTWG